MSLTIILLAELCDPAPLFAIIGAPYHCSSPKAESVATTLLAVTLQKEIYDELIDHVAVLQVPV